VSTGSAGGRPTNLQSPHAANHQELGRWEPVEAADRIAATAAIADGHNPRLTGLLLPKEYLKHLALS
jgi:hypothetical protein